MVASQSTQNFCAVQTIHGDTNNGGCKKGGLGRGEVQARAERASTHLSYPPRHYPNAEKRKAQAPFDCRPVTAALHHNMQATPSRMGSTVASQKVVLLSQYAGVVCPSAQVGYSNAAYPSYPTVGNSGDQKADQPTAIPSNTTTPSSAVTTRQANSLVGTHLTTAQTSERDPYSIPHASYEKAKGLTPPVIDNIYHGPHQLSPSTLIDANNVDPPNLEAHPVSKTLPSLAADPTAAELQPHSLVAGSSNPLLQHHDSTPAAATYTANALRDVRGKTSHIAETISNDITPVTAMHIETTIKDIKRQIVHSEIPKLTQLQQAPPMVSSNLILSFLLLIT
ncbi:hypothetical protein F0562_034139 [Nyssa sinensis]|uniref:Uncharacterized protein n=1 Tax=Nyssa sinensis TaxID=561372 RepID=A0A5J5AKT2_9ASTE|nr:hypothetical protein F0562_034139 [Nyssa sinensis]